MPFWNLLCSGETYYTVIREIDQMVIGAVETDLTAGRRQSLRCELLLVESKVKMGFAQV